jgi:four helix bundle protein
MTPKDLQERTKSFALRIMKFAEFLEKHAVGRYVGRQMFRSGTSVAANYRAACRAKSARDFISKLGIVVEEADETVFWLELSKEAGYVKEEQILQLMKEANEITAIMVASKNSAAQNQNHQKIKS